jgi:hypothetical protein
MSSDDSMRDADIANGEDPDEANRPPDREQSPETESVPTGERQADENRENDPPA